MTSLTYSEMMETIKKHQKNIPVNVCAIAKEFKIEILHENFSENQICGKIVKRGDLEGNTQFVISVNSSHIHERRRFTIAHEIAHFILHRDLIGDGITDDALYRSELTNSQEIMANKLAADILLPFQSINQKIKEGLDSVESLAKAFDVSPTAMSIRLGIPSGV